MGIITTVIIIYLVTGFLYAMWLWLFKAETFLSIIPNTLAGFPYILYAIYKAFTYRKFSFHRLFKNKKAVIFDLDGTLIDSQPVWDSAMEKVKKEVQLSDIKRNYPSGLNVREKWISLLSVAPGAVAVSLDKLVEATKQEFLSSYQAISPFEGFGDFIRFLKERNFKIGLASNTDRAVVMEVIKRMKAEQVFDFVIGGDEVKKRKPDPEMYKKALKGLKVSANDAVVFEDTVVGSQAAVDAGIDTVVVWDGNVEKVRYPSKVKAFIPDYQDMEYEITHSLKEKVEDAKRFIEEENLKYE